MMPESRRCMFLLLNAFAGLLSVSDAEITSKYVCPGDSVQAFQNIKFNCWNANVRLTRNGERDTEIATWSYQNCTLNATLAPDYENRLFLDENGTITINKFRHYDQAKYVAISKTDQLPMIYEVQLNAMVAPTKDCKPMIENLGDILIASLRADGCGEPVAFPYWKDHGGVSNISVSKLKLYPGKEAGTYFACINGPAVTCATNLTSEDYCSPFVIERTNSSTGNSSTGNSSTGNSSTETSKICNTAELKDALIGLIIISVFVFIWAIAVSLRHIQTNCRRRNLKANKNELLPKTPPTGTQHFEETHIQL